VSLHAMVSLVLMPRRPGMSGPWELAVRILVVKKHVQAILVQMATRPAATPIKLEEIMTLAVRSALQVTNPKNATVSHRW